MFGLSATAMHPATGWPLVFAREPEPDIDDLPQGLDENPGQRFLDNKPPNRRFILWVFALVMAAAVAYFLTQFGAETPEPPVVAKPKPAAPARPSAPGPSATTPASSAAAPAVPGAAPAPAGPSTMPPAPAAPGTGQVARPSVPSPVPTPLFKEGQKVVVQADPQQLTGTVFLTSDSAGIMPGPLVKPGSTLTVIDGELRNSAWVYSVKTEDGAEGWIPESRLRVKS